MINFNQNLNLDNTTSTRQSARSLPSLSSPSLLLEIKIESIAKLTVHPPSPSLSSSRVAPKPPDAALHCCSSSISLVCFSAASDRLHHLPLPFPLRCHANASEQSNLPRVSVTPLLSGLAPPAPPRPCLDWTLREELAPFPVVPVPLTNRCVRVFFFFLFRVRRPARRRAASAAGALFARNMVCTRFTPASPPPAACFC